MRREIKTTLTIEILAHKTLCMEHQQIGSCSPGDWWYVNASAALGIVSFRDIHHASITPELQD